MPTSPQRYSLTDALKWYDDDSRRARVERIEWASALYQPSGMIVGSLLPLSLLEEARICFVNGQFIGAVFCATAVVEHLLVEELENRGLTNGKVTLGPSIAIARDHLILPASACERMERLNGLRNPLVHRRDQQDPSTLVARYQAHGVHPTTILEADARFALEIMYEVFQLFLKRGA